ncbi:MAG: hypothetical protein WKF77_29525 [Planctomycetaceae bacterium]
MKHTTPPTNAASTSRRTFGGRISGEQGTMERTHMLMYLVLPIAAILIVTALAPLSPVDWWWVRMGDFPRVQLLIAYLIWLVVLAVLHKQPYAKPAAGLLLVSVCIQVYWIFPYLPVAPHQVEWAKSRNADVRLQILTANVLQDNQDATALLRLIDEESPDVVVLCEVNRRLDQRPFAASRAVQASDRASVGEQIRHCHVFKP